MQARDIDCIYLRPSNATTGSHEFYNMNTRKAISRRHCTSIPTPAHIINTIELHTQEKKMLNRITFHSNKIQHNELLFAGVDYDNTDEDYDNEDKEQNHIEKYDMMVINVTDDILYKPSPFHKTT